MTKRVLLVDPDTRFTEAVTRVFLRDHVVATAVSDQRTAIARARLLHPAVIVAADLASTDAFALCDVLRKTAALTSVPIVVLSNYTGTDMIERHRASMTAARLYLQRPISPEAFVDAIRDLVFQPAVVPSGAVEPLPIEEFDGLIESVRPAPIARTPSYAPAYKAPNVGFGISSAVQPGGGALARAIDPQTARVSGRSAIQPKVQVPLPTPHPTVASIAPKAISSAGISALDAEALRREVSELRRKSGELELRLKDSDARSRESLAALEEAKRSQAASVNALSARVNSAEMDALRATHDRDTVVTARDALENSRLHLQQSLARAVEISREFEAKLASERTRALDLSKQLVEARRGHDNARGSVESRVDESAALKEMIASLTSQLVEANSEIEDLRHEVDFLLAEVDRHAVLVRAHAKVG